MHTFAVRTHQRSEMIEITRQVREVVSQSGMKSGAVLVYVPHTTAACAINENADPDVARDILVEIARFVPLASDYHHAEGNSDSHIKSCLFGASQYVIVEDGRLVLGTWQGIFFCEFDGPRDRNVHVQLLRGYE